MDKEIIELLEEFEDITINCNYKNERVTDLKNYIEKIEKEKTAFFKLLKKILNKICGDCNYEYDNGCCYKVGCIYKMHIDNMKKEIGQSFEQINKEQE